MFQNVHTAPSSNWYITPPQKSTQNLLPKIMIVLHYHFKESHFGDFCKDLTYMNEDGKAALVFAPDSATATEIAIEVGGVAITDEMSDAQKKAAVLESEGGILVCTDVNMPAFSCLYEDIFSYHPPTGYVSQTVRNNKLTYQGHHMIYLLRD